MRREWLAIALIAWFGDATAAEAGGALVGSGGLVAGQPGASLEVEGALAVGELVLEGRLGLGGRVAILPTAIEGGQDPFVGLAGGAIGYGIPIDRAHRIGPMAWADLAVLPAAELDCGEGSGCRHRYWASGGLVGVAVAPAAGLRFERLGADERAFVATLGIQPTLIYDIFVPIAPRLEVAWTRADRWIVGVRAHRYGAGLRVGRAL